MSRSGNSYLFPVSEEAKGRRSQWKDTLAYCHRRLHKSCPVVQLYLFFGFCFPSCVTATIWQTNKFPWKIIQILWIIWLFCSSFISTATQQSESGDSLLLDHPLTKITNSKSCNSSDPWSILDLLILCLTITHAYNWKKAFKFTAT